MSSTVATTAAPTATPTATHRLDVDGAIGIGTAAYPPVNAPSRSMCQAIVDGIAAAQVHQDVQAMVFICDGRSFLVGADITDFGKPPQAPSLYEAQDLIENSAKPVITAMHGTSLGGGLEVALCCHYRVAVPSAKCGLPEVDLGLLPGASGTRRLPRIVGAPKALEFITSGTQVPARQCLETGLVDAVVSEVQLRDGAIAFARQVLAEGRPLRKVRDADDKVLPARGRPARGELDAPRGVIHECCLGRGPQYPVASWARRKVLRAHRCRTSRPGKARRCATSTPGRTPCSTKACRPGLRDAPDQREAQPQHQDHRIPSRQPAGQA